MRIPPNIDNLKIDHLLLYFARAENESFEVDVTHLKFTLQGTTVPITGSGSTSVDGVISTRRGNAGDWVRLIGRSPIGEWEIALSPAMETIFNSGQIEDILFVITFSARTAAWPE
ncbi:MAG: hypothetical protein MRJ65_01790 [Candidatus Brocadiaceae bacterium]|nr:hypothetical protein [Candidatus Brocadiaceae bacterium]